MSRPTVMLIETGVANLASWEAAFARLGHQTRRSRDPRELVSADLVVLPGVGAFDHGVEALERDGTGAAVVERWNADRPTLAVCLGLQLLCEQSHESLAGRRGLGVIPGTIVPLPGSVRVPQLGWNYIEARPDSVLLRSGHVYFANSFALAEAPSGYRTATFEHGERFIAGFERGRTLACQFHPELSGAFGQQLLARWLESATPGDESC